MNAVAAVVVPVFGTVALGYGLARSRLFSAEAGAGLVRFMYYLAIPALLIDSVQRAELPATLPLAFLAAFYGPSFLLYAIGMSATRVLLGWEARDPIMGGMTASYSNIVLLGYPVVLSAFGAGGTMPLFILLATQSMLLFPFTTWLLERAGTAPEQGGGALRALQRLALNPVLVSLALGIGLNLTDATLPEPLARMLKLLGSAGPACALVALGISLAQYRLVGGYRDALFLIALKNALHPVLVWGGCVALRIETSWTQVAVLLAAMPCGLNAFIFASQYRVREETVSKSVVLSTALSSLVAALILSWMLP